MPAYKQTTKITSLRELFQQIPSVKLLHIKKVPEKNTYTGEIDLNNTPTGDSQRIDLQNNKLLVEYIHELKGKRETEGGK